MNGRSEREARLSMTMPTQNEMDMQISDLDPDLDTQDGVGGYGEPLRPSDAEIQQAWRRSNRAALRPARGMLAGIALGAAAWLAIAWLWWEIVMRLTD